MKRYIMGTILIANLALGMDRTEQESLLIDLEVQLCQELSGHAREVLARRIINLRKELGRTDLYHDIPGTELDKIAQALPGVPDSSFSDIAKCSKAELYERYSNTPSNTPEGKAVAQRWSELQEMELKDELRQDIAKEAVAEVVKKFGKVDNIASEMQLRAELDKARATAVPVPKIPIAQMNRAQIEALIQENSGMMFPPESEYMEAMEARCKELKMWPYDKPEASVPQATPTSPAASAAPDQLPAFDEIAKMNKDQLHAYEQQLIAKEGAVSPYLKSVINERRETLAVIERENALLKKGVTAAERALSPKRVHFEEVSADSMPKTKLPGDPAGSDSDYDLLDQTPKPAKLKLITTVEVFPAKEFQAGEPTAPLNPKDFASDSDSDLPDLERYSSHDENVPQLVGTNLPTQPVAHGQDPLTRIPTPSVQEPKAAPSPAASPVPDEDTVADVRKAAELLARQEKRLIEELSKKENGQHQTPGRPAATGLPVEPIAQADGPLYGSQSPEHAVKYRSARTLKEEQTPGGSGADESNSSDSDGGSSSGSSPQLDSSYSTTQKVLIGAGIVAAVYASTEVVLAYKSITPAQWKNAHGLLNKTKLVLNKTWQQVKARPTQGIELLKELAGKRKA